jgi:serine/threonine protein kinase
MTSLAPQPSPPARVGQYEILCELGRGGMAVLYLARLVGLGGFERLFALKMIHDDLGRDPAFVQMFLDEARLVARIRHPNVVPVYEVGIDRGRYYIAMDYVSGETLGAALAATWPRQRPFPIALAMHIIAMAGEGLHAAHELTDQRGQSSGVIHRDVAPGNIMLGYDGAVRVMDFGVAKVIDQSSGAAPEALKGTLAYMAPELMRGISRADRRADVFALGVLLWEMCVGKRLFKGRTDVETARRVMRLDVPVPSKGRPEISPALDDVILRALAREPGQRPATARALSEELQQALVSSGHVTTSGDVERFLREHFAERLERRREMERKAAQATVPDDLEGVVIEEEAPLPEQVDDADVEPLSDDEMGRAPPETAAPRESVVAASVPSDLGASATSAKSVASHAPAPAASDTSELGELDASLASALDAAVATAIGSAAEPASEVPELEDGLIVVGTQRPRGDSPRMSLGDLESLAPWSRTGTPERSPRGEAVGAVTMSALAALAAQEAEVEAVAGSPSADLGQRSATRLTPTPAASIASLASTSVASIASPTSTSAASTLEVSMAVELVARPELPIRAEATVPMAPPPRAAQPQVAIPAEATVPMAPAPLVAWPRAPIPAEITVPMTSSSALRPAPAGGTDDVAPVGPETSDTERALVGPVRAARLLEQRELTMVVRTRRTPRELLPLDVEARAREDREVEALVREAQGSRWPAPLAAGLVLLVALGGAWWASAREPRVIAPTAQIADPRAAASDQAQGLGAPATLSPREGSPSPVSPPPARAELEAPPAAAPAAPPARAERASPAMPAPAAPSLASQQVESSRAPAAPRTSAAAAPRAGAARPQAAVSPPPSPTARAARASRVRSSPSPRRDSRPALISGSDL